MFLFSAFSWLNSKIKFFCLNLKENLKISKTKKSRWKKGFALVSLRKVLKKKTTNKLLACMCFCRTLIARNKIYFSRHAFLHVGSKCLLSNCLLVIKTYNTLLPLFLLCFLDVRVPERKIEIKKNVDDFFPSLRTCLKLRPLNQ